MARGAGLDARFVGVGGLVFGVFVGDLVLFEVGDDEALGNVGGAVGEGDRAKDAAW